MTYEQRRGNARGFRSGRLRANQCEIDLIGQKTADCRVGKWMNYLFLAAGSSYSPSTSVTILPLESALPLYVPLPLMPLNLPVPPV